MGSVAGREGSRERSLGRRVGRVPRWCSPEPRSPFAQPRAPLSFVDELNESRQASSCANFPAASGATIARTSGTFTKPCVRLGGDATPRRADGSTFACARARLPSPPARVPPPVDGNAPARAQPRSSAGTRPRGPAVGSAHRWAGARVPPVHKAVAGCPRGGRSSGLVRRSARRCSRHGGAGLDDHVAVGCLAIDVTRPSWLGAFGIVGARARGVLSGVVGTVVHGG